jgi:hypothetical protein
MLGGGSPAAPYKSYPLVSHYQNAGSRFSASMARPNDLIQIIFNLAGAF